MEMLFQLQGDHYETVIGNLPKSKPAATAMPLVKSGDIHEMENLQEVWVELKRVLGWQCRKCC